MDTQVALDTGAITAVYGEAIYSTPLVIWLTFAIASGAGLVGAIFIFSRSATVTAVFVLSLVSALIYFGWNYGVSGTGVGRPPEEIIIAVVVVSVTLAFLLISRRWTLEKVRT